MKMRNSWRWPLGSGRLAPILGLAEHSCNSQSASGVSDRRSRGRFLSQMPRTLEQSAPRDTAERVGVSMERSRDVFGGSIIECVRRPGNQAFLQRMDRRKQPARRRSRTKPPVPFLDRLRISQTTSIFEPSNRIVPLKAYEPIHAIRSRNAQTRCSRSDSYPALNRSFGARLSMMPSACR
jgi:hypothetical protein